MARGVHSRGSSRLVLGYEVVTALGYRASCLLAGDRDASVWMLSYILRVRPASANSSAHEARVPSLDGFGQAHLPVAIVAAKILAMDGIGWRVSNVVVSCNVRTCATSAFVDLHLSSLPLQLAERIKRAPVVRSCQPLNTSSVLLPCGEGARWKLPHQQIVWYRRLPRHLLHEERNALGRALVTQRSSPSGVHGPSFRAALAATDDPVRPVVAER